MDTAQQAIEAAFVRRAKSMGLKPGTKTYAKEEVAFFLGAVSALKESKLSVPAVWILMISAGRSITEQLFKSVQ